MILKVEDSTQYTTKCKDKVVSENEFAVYSDAKVENDDRLNLVFGQSGGSLIK